MESKKILTEDERERIKNVANGNYLLLKCWKALQAAEEEITQLKKLPNEATVHTKVYSIHDIVELLSSKEPPPTREELDKQFEDLQNKIQAIEIKFNEKNNIHKI